MKNHLRLALGVVALGVLSLGTGGCPNPYEKIVRAYGIANVFKVPTAAYGPGTVVIYADGGYSLGLAPWYVIGCTKDEYEQDLEAVRSGKSGKFLASATTADLGQTRKREFTVTLTNEEKAKIDAKYHKISKATIAFSSGKQYDVVEKYSKLIGHIVENKENLDSICLRMEPYLNKPNSYAAAHLIVTSYGFDIESQVDINGEWKIAAELPNDVLGVLSKKLGVDFNVKLGVEGSSESGSSINGKGLFIGFNGTPVDAATYQRRAEDVENPRAVTASYPNYRGDYDRELQSLKDARAFDLTSFILAHRKK